MALTRLSAFLRADGRCAYYIRRGAGSVRTPQFLDDTTTPEQVLGVVRARGLVPKLPYRWRVVYRDNVKSRGNSHYLNSVAMTRADTFLGPLRPEDTYDFETAALVWADYVRMLNPPRRIKS